MLDNQSSYVLIVPLWNWNGETIKLGYNGFTRSNRTFMELKYGIPNFKSGSGSF